MSVMVMTCPHCNADNMTFNVRADAAHKANPKQQSALAFCAQCDKPVVVMAELISQAQRPHDWHIRDTVGSILESKELKVLGLWPKRQAIDAPENLPDKVLRAYMDAAQARRAKLWNPACGAYRRCMELALKEFAPDVEAWKIEKRIDKLAAANRITPDVQAWAHELRLDGNEAVHGDEDATQELADQMHHLTYFLLTYLYTLPQQVEAARNRRAGAGLA